MRGVFSSEVAQQQTAAKSDSAIRTSSVGGHFRSESSMDPGTAHLKISQSKENGNGPTAAHNDPAKLNFLLSPETLIASPASSSARTYSSRHRTCPANTMRLAHSRMARYAPFPVRNSSQIIVWQYAGGRRQNRVAAVIFRVPPRSMHPPERIARCSASLSKSWTVPNSFN